MRNYLCKWPNGDIVLISARDKLQAREILDEEGDPGACEIVRMKGAFAIEYIPKVPRPPRQDFHNPGPGFDSKDFEAPADPTIRPNIVRWAGNTGQTIYADLYQEYGGQLAPAEAAAVERWKAAVQQQQRRSQGRGAAAAAAAEPWVTEQQLRETGLLDNPYHIQANLGRTEYGRYSSRILKQVTKHFFPRTHDALKPLADERAGFGDRDADEEDDRNDSIMALRAALAADVKDKEKEDEQDRKRARLMAAANSGDKNAILQIMTDQTANVYGPEDDDDEDELDTDEEDDDSSDDGMDVLNALRHGRALGLAAALGVPR